MTDNNPVHAEYTMRGYYAGFVTRALALIIDLLIIFLASFLFALIAKVFLSFFGLDELTTAVYDQTAVSETTLGSVIVTFIRWFTAFLTSAFFLFIYLVFFWTVVGITPGKAILGLRVVQDGKATVNFNRAVVRALGYYVSFLVLGLGFWSVLWDDERRGWHDKMAHTHVLYTWDARVGKRLLDRLRRMRAGQLAAELTDNVIDPTDAQS